MRPDEQDPFDVRLSRQMNASAEHVFDAFTKPELLLRWFTTSAEADLRVGGRYSNADHDEGEFLIIDRPRQLHFTWENEKHCPGTVVEVEFEPLSSDSVAVTLHHRGIETHDGTADMQRGWSWALDSLKSFMERGVPIPHSEWEAAHSEDSKI